MPKISQQRLGEIYILIDLPLIALFPIIINYSAKQIPPIFFGAMILLCTAVFFFFYLLITKQLKSIFHKQGFKYALAVTFFIIFLPYLFILPGTKLTSAVNTSIFLQMELFFSFLICALFYKEKITKNKIVSTLIILTGTTLVLYNNSFKLNWGDLMIITATIFYPIGNIYAKKALKYISSITLLFVRGFFGGLSLLMISLVFENDALASTSITSNIFWIIILQGFLVIPVEKILWYESLKRLEITKITPLLACYPAFSLIFAFLFLKETATPYQIAGLIFIMIGIYLITKKNGFIVSKKLPPN